MKRCVLRMERVCNDCGECDDRCELDPQKICDNCFRCLEEDTRAFARISVSGVFFDDDFSPERGEGYPDGFGDGFMPDLCVDWRDEELVHAQTLPTTYGARPRRTHHKR